MEHAFAIPVYGEAIHLEFCIESILHQTLKSTIVLGTSTPSESLRRLATRYGLEVLVNSDRSDIATDWNFVLDRSATPLVTIAHQDDIYHPDYLKTITGLAGSDPDCLMAFTDYEEVTDQGDRPDTLNLKVKRQLCRRAFRGQRAISTRRAKRRLLSLGNPVCCPSVVINRTSIPDFRFSRHYKTNLDWDAWLRLADMPGAFLYCPDKLVAKRIHQGSETSVTIANRTRQREDREMFERLWPKPVAAMISSFYSLGYIGNEVSL